MPPPSLLLKYIFFEIDIMMYFYSNGFVLSEPVVSFHPEYKDGL